MGSSDSNEAAPPIDLNSQSLPFVEQLFQQYLAKPESVSPDWRHYFASMSNGVPSADGGAVAAVSRGSSPPPSDDVAAASVAQSPEDRNGHAMPDDLQLAAKQERIDQLVRNYRVRGHISADL